jgi:hypothetical protein
LRKLGRLKKTVNHLDLVEVSGTARQILPRKHALAPRRRPNSDRSYQPRIRLIAGAICGKFIRYSLAVLASPVSYPARRIKGRSAGYVSEIFDLVGVAGVLATGYLSDRPFSGQRFPVVSPRSEVALLGFGSHTRFWKSMAIFIVEDDAQNGVDHVDGHRTVALAVSPYIRKGSVDSTFYSHQSILKTIELMLGLLMPILFDLIANDMPQAFRDEPDFAPYNAVTLSQSLFEPNPPVSDLSGPARAAAIASGKMRWNIPDAAPTEKLNRILWGSDSGLDHAVPRREIRRVCTAGARH